MEEKLDVPWVDRADWGSAMHDPSSVCKTLGRKRLNSLELSFHTGPELSLAMELQSHVAKELFTGAIKETPCC